MPPRSSCESFRVPLTYGRAALVSIASAPVSEVSPSVAVRSASETRSLPPVSELDKRERSGIAPGGDRLAARPAPERLHGGRLEADVAFEREPGSHLDRPVVAGLDRLSGELER